MSELLNIHMASDLSEWSSTVTDSGDLSWQAGAGLAGTSGGMQCVIDDTNVIYGLKSITADTSGVVRIRLYIDPNSLVMANNDVFYFALLYNSASATIARIALQYTTASGYGIYAGLFDDGATPRNTAVGTITDEPHYVEVNLIRATNSTSLDGSIQLWIDGADIGSSVGRDNYDRFNDVKYFWVGAASGIDAGTSGTIYFDEIVANNDGGQIGPVVTGYTMDADVGLFAVSGVAASLLNHRNLDAGAGSYTLSGVDAALLNHHTLPADVGSISLSGIDAALLFHRVLAAAVGAYTITGIDASLEYNPSSLVYTLNAETGTLTLTGISVDFLRSYILAAAIGTYVLTGIDAGLFYTTPGVSRGGIMYQSGRGAYSAVDQLFTSGGRGTYPARARD